MRDEDADGEAPDLDDGAVTCRCEGCSSCGVRPPSGTEGEGTSGRGTRHERACFWNEPQRYTNVDAKRGTKYEGYRKLCKPCMRRAAKTRAEAVAEAESRRMTVRREDEDSSRGRDAGEKAKKKDDDDDDDDDDDGCDSYVVDAGGFIVVGATGDHRIVW